MADGEVDPQAAFEERIKARGARAKRTNGAERGAGGKIGQPESDPSAGGPPVEIPLSELMTAAQVELGTVTESGLTDVFVSLAADRLRYDHGEGKWYLWNGNVWRRDERREAYDAVRRLGEASTMSEKKAALLRSTRRSGFANGVEKFAQSDPRVSVTPSSWDRDPGLLGTPGGVVNLKTGILLPPDPALMISKQTSVIPQRMPTPLWDAFLAEAMGVEAAGDDEALLKKARELIAFVQVWYGYSATGETKEEQLVFNYGDGGTGKGTLVNTIVHLLGDYATVATMDMFMASRGERHTTDLAMLRGARMVTAQETQEGSTFNEGRVKAMTGGDPITARFMRRDNFTYLPQFKLTLSGNHAPKLNNVDNSIRRRFNIIPFEHQPEAKNEHLKERLIKEEGPGILQWVIDGAVRWYAEGLEPPPIVLMATDSYLAEQEVVKRWFNEDCELGEHARDTIKNLYASYRNFMEGEPKVLSKNQLSAALVKMGFRAERTMTARMFHGLRAPPIDLR